LLAPLDSPQLAGFVARLDDINALADSAPGFVWRLQTPEGNATARPLACTWRKASRSRSGRPFPAPIDGPDAAIAALPDECPAI